MTGRNRHAHSTAPVAVVILILVAIAVTLAVALTQPSLMASNEELTSTVTSTSGSMTTTTATAKSMGEVLPVDYNLDVELQLEDRTALGNLMIMRPQWSNRTEAVAAVQKEIDSWLAPYNLSSKIDSVKFGKNGPMGVDFTIHNLPVEGGSLKYGYTNYSVGLNWLTDWSGAPFTQWTEERLTLSSSPSMSYSKEAEGKTYRYRLASFIPIQGLTEITRRSATQLTYSVFIPNTMTNLRVFQDRIQLVTIINFLNRTEFNQLYAQGEQYRSEVLKNVSAEVTSKLNRYGLVATNFEVYLSEPYSALGIHYTIQGAVEKVGGEGEYKVDLRFLNITLSEFTVSSPPLSGTVLMYAGDISGDKTLVTISCKSFSRVEADYLLYCSPEEILTTTVASTIIVTSTTTSTLTPTQTLSQSSLQLWNQSGVAYYCQPSAIEVFGDRASPVSMPVKFNMSTAPAQGCYTLRKPYFGTLLVANTPYLVNITSTAPVSFTLMRANGNDPSKLYSEAYNARTVLSESQVTSLNKNITVNQDGLYIFVFNVEKHLPIATVYFSVRPANMIVVNTTTVTTSASSATKPCGSPGVQCGNFKVASANLDVNDDNNSSTLRITLDNTGDIAITDMTVYINDTVLGPTPSSLGPGNMNVRIPPKSLAEIKLNVPQSTILIKAGDPYKVLVVTGMSGSYGVARDTTVIATGGKIITTTITETTTRIEADSSTYAWATGATVATVVLAAVVVLLLRRAR